eukprot:scaffold435155_cov18-Prasinocladus_malaysianus.AAC.2
MIRQYWSDASLSVESWTEQALTDSRHAIQSRQILYHIAFRPTTMAAAAIYFRHKIGSTPLIRQGTKPCCGDANDPTLYVSMDNVVHAIRLSA